MVIWSLLLVFWLAVLIALACAVWINRDYPEKVALIARADAEHNALMDGDIETGTYGQFPPAV